ncbi:hypothetical protein PPYR_08233 [Photinus pyralis]|uniref:Uncharacterized protein n=1 Tax=Photinus pyralis TaxID=7054 RepID=A0A1Y1K0I3_PHOPY|nr:transmembrane protein 272-like [Photinus pyralis]KAB0797239.1 hypothetical protein PPYR_08233 [Photinus pyralis]
MATSTPSEEANVTKIEAGSLELEARLPNDEEKAELDKIKDKYKKPAAGTFYLIYVVLNTVMLCVGIITAQDCPINPKIPIYLAVAGAVGIVSKLLPFINYKLQLNVLQWIAYLLYVFEFAWMIAGSVWIYSIYQPNYHPSEGPHCDKTAYLLAFWLLTINYIYIGLTILFTCCILGCLLVCVAKFINFCKSIED